MWIQGRRRGGAKDLSNHLQKTEENELVTVCALEGFSFKELTGQNLAQALRQMEAIGQGKGDKRNLYHAIIAPAYDETLTAAQREQMVAYYAKHLGFTGHHYALVEHWKKGKQHFHLVFNIIDPVTGKTHELKWTKQKEWRIARGLEQLFGHATPAPKGKAARTQETQRGKRTGIEPCRMRQEVTALFHASQTSQEFIAGLEQAGYALTRGKRQQLVLVDRFGDTHGLMRRIEGATLAELRRKFVGIEQLALPKHAALVQARKGTQAKRVHSVNGSKPRSSGGTARGSKGKEAVGRNKVVVGRPPIGINPPSLPAPPSRADLRAAFVMAAHVTTSRAPRKSFAPSPPHDGGWPPAAIREWKAWGCRNPRGFFARWPELATDNTAPSETLQH